MALVALATMLTPATSASADWRGERLNDSRLLSRWSFSAGDGTQLPLTSGTQPAIDDKGRYNGTWQLAGRATSASGNGPNMNAVLGVAGVPGANGDKAADANWGWRGVYESTGGCTSGSGPAGNRGSNSVKFSNYNSGNIYNFIHSGQTFSVEAWFKTREGSGNGVGAAANGGEVLLNKESSPTYQICGYRGTYDTALVQWSSTSTSPSTGYSLGIAKTGSDTGRIRFQFGSYDATYNQPPSPNVWHQVVGVRDSNQLRLYYDGKLVALSSGAPGPMPSYTNGSFGIAGYSGVAGVYPRNFPGALDDISIVGGALTADEVCDSYRGGTARGPWRAGHCRAERFRPSLRFDSGETYRPLDVDLFFGERNDQGQPLHEVCTASCTALGSKADLPASEQSRLDIAGDGDADSYHSPYAQCTQNDLRDCDSDSRSAIYYWQTSPPGSSITYLDYWMFYRYNDWPGIVAGDHEGDWESVTVGMSSPTARTFDFASFSQHGNWYSYLRENLSCDGGAAGSCGTGAQRLTVYPAQGSHANYPDVCASDTCSRNGGGPVGEGRHDGNAPWANDYVEGSLLPLEDPGTDGSWTGWAGHWGSPHERGPASPAREGNGAHFNAPWTSTCADHNDDCIVLAKRRTRTPSARAAAVRTNDQCKTWLGAGVVAAACVPSRIRAAIARRGIGQAGSLTFRRSRRNSYRLRVAASAAGLAQALGEPLRPGQRLALKGRSARSTELLVRARTSSHLVTARFARLGLSRRGTATVLVKRSGKVPTVRLATPDGRRLSPVSLRTTRLKVLKRPRIRHVRRLADGRVSITYTASTRAVVLQALGQGQRAVFERSVRFRHEGTHRVVIPSQRAARRIMLFAVTSQRMRSRPVGAPVPSEARTRPKR